MAHNLGSPLEASRLAAWYASKCVDPLPQRIRRALELVYGVEGVIAARVWQTPGCVAIGVRGAAVTAPSELLRRVESAVAGLRQPGEAWDFGILDDAEG
jgi:hypothetical protein